MQKGSQRNALLQKGLLLLDSYVRTLFKAKWARAADTVLADVAMTCISLAAHERNLLLEDS